MSRGNDKITPMLRVTLSALFAFSILLAQSEPIRTVKGLSQAFEIDKENPISFDLDAIVSAPPVIDQINAAIPITDKTGTFALRCNIPTSHPFPKLGTRIQLKGFVKVRSPGYPQVNLSFYQNFQNEHILKPREITIAELKSGSFDWHYSQVKGLVRDILPSDTNANWIFLVLCADNDTFTVAIPLNGAAPRDFHPFLRKQVIVNGFCCPQDNSPRLYQGRIFQASGIAAIKTISTAPSDRISAIPIEQLRFKHPSEIAVCGLARTKGQVISRWGGCHALLKTADDDFIHLVCSDCKPPARHAFIEATGFPQSDLFHITLRHATWRECKSLAIKPPAIRSISMSIFHAGIGTNAGALPAIHGNTIVFRARVKSLPDKAMHDNLLIVEDSDCYIPVDISSAPGAVRGVLPNALVEITATCVLCTEVWSPSLSFPQIHGFTAVLNDEYGIRILARPPWWTIGRVLTAVGIVFLVLIGLVIYGQLSRARAVLKKNERTRLAVELHDTLAQSLMGVSLELEAAHNARGNANDAMTEHLETASRVLTSCRQDLKDCLWDLRTNALDEADLNDAIRTTLQPHIDDERLSVRCNLPFNILPDTAKHAILRIVRELVINALRHGNATHIRIAGCVDKDNLLISVTDNGCGFEPDSAPGILQGHYGLQGIRERITELHGCIKIRSSVGKGTNCRITMPINSCT